MIGRGKRVMGNATREYVITSIVVIVILFSFIVFEVVVNSNGGGSSTGDSGGDTFNIVNGCMKMKDGFCF